jgi:glycolate oxidase
MRNFLENLLGSENVLHEAKDFTEYREDFTEVDPIEPGLVAFATTTEQIQAIVKEAGKTGMPITARVAGTNLGGLALPAEGGLVLDLSRMNKILEVNADDMYAVLEPGVTQQQLKDHLLEQDLPLTLGYSLAPPYTSVAINALMGGLTNRSLKYGDQSQWISGLEVVLPDGSLARTGAWALSGISPFGLIPFPDLSGLFIGWVGTTGIATKIAFQLWPKHPVNRRLFILSYSVGGTYDAMRRLCRAEICDDIGGLSWPSGKMMLGVKRPHPEPSPGEPVFFLYVDLTAETEREMAAKEEILRSVIAEVEQTGARFEAPLDVKDLVEVNPGLTAFADFPTDLEFLTNHGGGGLTWIGTYGPLSRFTEGAEAGIEVMVRRGVAPLIVSRPMRGGHFGVLRLISIFDKADAAEVQAIRELNLELLEVLTAKGFIMYKTPAWAWKELSPKMDPGMVSLMGKVKAMLDPDGIMNPGKLGLG